MTHNVRTAALRPRANLQLLLSCLLLATGAVSAPSQAHADDWYVGIGGASNQLSPNTESGVDAEEDLVFGPTVFLGHDVNKRLSVQLQLHGLVEVNYEPSTTEPGNNSASYTGVDGSVLYRVLDSRNHAGRGEKGMALYARFGLGFMDRDSDLDLEDDEPLWFGLGAGIEFYVSHKLAVRAEGLYLDEDAVAGSLSLVGRFGRQDESSVPAQTPRPAPSEPPAALTSETPAEPPTEPPAPPATPTESISETVPNSPAVNADDQVADQITENKTSTNDTRPAEQLAAPTTRASVANDRDDDGITDTRDACPGSTRGFPVQDNGCALLDGVLTGVRFTNGTADLVSGATKQLDFLADVLTQYPGARIEMHAHSDDTGSAREQAIITRARLKTVGTYLVGRGVSANRLTLRSFGGARPLYSNDTPTGRADNNRIEIIEKRF